MIQSPLRHGELAAAGRDVDAASLAHGAGEIVFGQNLLEAVGSFAPGGLTIVTVRGIEGDQVHLRLLALEETAHRMGVFGSVVFALDQRPFVENPAARRLTVGAARRHQFVKWPLFRRRHEGGALGLRGGVKRPTSGIL